jgi:1,4-dihydroxy-2-naphthoyl-CoA hydrolase
MGKEVQASFWFAPQTSIATANAWRAGTIVEHLDIRITAIGSDWIEGTVEVDERTRTASGRLHGGASAVLAETLGSYASNLVLDPARQRAVGQEISAAYLRHADSGRLTGRATPIDIAPETQVWSIAVRDESGTLLALWRLRMAVLEIR